MLNWIITFFKKLFGFVTLQPPSTDVKPEPDSEIAGLELDEDSHVVSDEEALETLESTQEEELPKGIRLIDGERYFWSAITGWTKSPTSETYPQQVKGTPIEGPPFAWNLAGQIGQPRYKPDDWTEKGPDYDRDAYRAKHPVA